MEKNRSGISPVTRRQGRDLASMEGRQGRDLASLKRPERNPRRGNMAVAQRAKQFMPFAAVTGLEKALREKEKEFDNF